MEVREDPHPSPTAGERVGLAHPGAVLLDIEGTTTPISFVYETLFSYARARLKDFVASHWRELEHELGLLRQEHAADVAAGQNPPGWRNEPEAAHVESAIEYLEWLMDGDRKSTALKAIQGKIWKEGYESGALRGEVFPDVELALRAWKEAGRKVAIFSSGSQLAQRLLFAHSTAGDLSRYIDAYFDTTTGAKTDPASYAAIARELNRAAGEIVFVSDVTAELDAARTAGLQTLLSVRPGNRPQPESGHGRVLDLRQVFRE